MADVKTINLTTGIGTHESCVVRQPREEFVALTGLQLSAYSDKNVKTPLLWVSLCALTLQPTQP